MSKEELFNIVIDLVADTTGVSRECILTSKCEESTDARSIAVKVLSRYLTDVQIAKLMGITARGVNYIRETFLLRSRKWFVRSNYEAVMKRIGSNALIWSG
jgi:hypothetical protein